MPQKHILISKNKSGRNTYNFWRTDSSYTFPYTGWIHLIKSNTALPDDMDDTVFGMLALQADKKSAEQLHALMQFYINTNTANQKSIEPAYKKFHAYSTWFGKKFPVVFDVAVLCNILSFVQQNNLQWTHADSASLQLIVAVCNNGDYKKCGNRIALLWKNFNYIISSCTAYERKTFARTGFHETCVCK